MAARLPVRRWTWGRRHGSGGSMRRAGVGRPPPEPVVEDNVRRLRPEEVDGRVAAGREAATNPRRRLAEGIERRKEKRR